MFGLIVCTEGIQATRSNTYMTVVTNYCEFYFDIALYIHSNITRKPSY